jgi:hypothetical protein
MILADGGVEGALPVGPSKDGIADVVIGVGVGFCPFGLALLRTALMR